MHFRTTSYRSGRSETEVSLKRYKYCGKERDEQTGFYYYGMRYYAAWLCRFVSVDPMADEYLNLTPYAYCGNNPIRFIDPTGESWRPYDKDGNEIDVNDYDNIHGYKWIDYTTDENGNKVARANTVETAYTFGVNGMTTLTSEGYKPQTSWQAYSNISTGNARTDAKLATLHPDVQDQMKSFILIAKYRYGIDLRVTDAYRTYAEQDAIYAKGRTAAGSIVTNAKGGQSNHNFGLAIDVVPFENGKINYKTSQWKLIGRIGESRGLEWGGRWRFVDKPHFQNLFGNTLKQLRALKKDDNGLPIFNNRDL
jgi:RHS repeat-associated protein